MRSLKNFICVFIVLMTFTAANAVTYRLEGNLSFAGISMGTMTSVTPTFHCWSAYTGEPIGITTSYNPDGAAYSIDGIPDDFVCVSIIFHTSGTFNTQAGNYHCTQWLSPGDMTEEERLNNDINMQLIMHTTEPFDNSLIGPSVYQPDPVRKAPVVFRWDPIYTADYYLLYIDVYRDDNHPLGWACVERICEESTMSTSYIADLPLSNPMEHYQATIETYNASNDKIAYYMTTYSDGSGWDYRFKVRNCPAGDLNNDCKVNFLDLAVIAGNWLDESLDLPYEDLTRADIAAMADELSVADIDGSDGNEFLPTTYFIYKTNEGRFGKFQVDNLEPRQNNRLTIRWVTYNSDGSVYSSGLGLIIEGTFNCDLDTGTEGSGTTSDWWWQLFDPATRWLTPRNDAAFKLMYRAR